MDMEATKQTQAAPKKRPKSGAEVVGQVRRALLDAMYSDSQQKRYLKRQVVESLIGVLSAARSSGLDWEEMAKICGDHGFEISPNTLKSYYVDLKEERESQKIRAQANKIVQTKKEIDLKREIKQGASDTLDARRRAQQRLATKPKLMSIDRLRSLEEPKTASESELATNPPPAAGSSARKAPPAPTSSSTAPPKYPPKQAAASPPKNSGPLQEEDRPSFPELKAGQGKSIEQLEVESKIVETATQVSEHLVLKNGRVYYESGAPFVDVLAPRQVSMLKMHGRYIANAMADSRSSSSVVPMKNNL